MEGGPYDHSPHSGSADEILSLGDNIFAVCVLPTACGDATCTSELGGLYGSLTRTAVCEGDHYDQSPPCQSALTSRHGGMGTNSSILHAASGGNQHGFSTDDHYGRTGRDPGWTCDACRHCPNDETPSSSCLGWPCSNSSIIYAAIAEGLPCVPCRTTTTVARQRLMTNTGISLRRHRRCLPSFPRYHRARVSGARAPIAAYYMLLAEDPPCVPCRTITTIARQMLMTITVVSLRRHRRRLPSLQTS
jgi:hypothetical protein